MALTLEKIQTGGALLFRLDTFPIFCAYMFMVLLASQWKKILSPLNLRHILVVYNFIASAISLLTVCGFTYGLLQAESSFEKRSSEFLLPIFKIYWMTKIFELLDTVFMILRHKQRQISFLHVYHHGSIMILSDICYHHYPYIAIAPYLALNSIVHVVLYLYYGLSALYPDNPPQWKRFLTQFQIAQFFIDLVHATFGYLYHGYCIYGIFYGFTMVGLFTNFYINAYIKRKSPKSATNGTSVTNGTSIITNGVAASKKNH